MLSPNSAQLCHPAIQLCQRLKQAPKAMMLSSQQAWTKREISMMVPTGISLLSSGPQASGRRCCFHGPVGFRAMQANENGDEWQSTRGCGTRNYEHVHSSPKHSTPRNTTLLSPDPFDGSFSVIDICM
jgi:hypothetical protein